MSNMELLSDLEAEKLTKQKLKQYSGTPRILQGNLCTLAGIDCYRDLSNEKSKCLRGCEGLFSVLRKKEKLENAIFESLLTRYEAYKRGFQDMIVYPLSLKGKFQVYYSFLSNSINKFRIQSKDKASSSPDIF